MSDREARSDLKLNQRRFISIKSIYPLTDIFRLKHIKCRVNLEISKKKRKIVNILLLIVFIFALGAQKNRLTEYL